MDVSGLPTNQWTALQVPNNLIDSPGKATTLDPRPMATGASCVCLALRSRHVGCLTCVYRALQSQLACAPQALSFMQAASSRRTGY
jgi:hypothetical protein